MRRVDTQSYPTPVTGTDRIELVKPGQRRKLAGRRFHFIGAGGVGMSGLARFLLENRAIVTGSDRTASAVTSRLNRSGAAIHIGHHADHLPPEVDTVVITAAIREGNPELQLARQRGCRVVKYAQLLGELMDRYEGIAVSGTHGKSTTSGWLVHCLQSAGVDVNFVVGADIVQLGTSSGSGSSEFLVAEACEYDRSFLNLSPTVACILNVERDHLDCYRDEADIIDAFYQFSLGSKPDGWVVANGQDANVARLMERLADQRPVVTFGLEANCTFCARNVREQDGFYDFDVSQDGSDLGHVELSVPGLHNVFNGLAVVAMAVGIGVEAERVLHGLGDFTGMDRRLMLKGTIDGITVMDDYAHHPTEIKSSLDAIARRYRPRRLWCVYQAHQYSRTHLLLDEFATSFAQADMAILPEIYFVRDSEASRDRVNADVLAGRIRDQGTEAVYIKRFDAICDYLEEHASAGDVVVTMGAGDVWKVSDEYIRRLRADR